MTGESEIGRKRNIFSDITGYVRATTYLNKKNE